jgi:hypothetical protein
MAEAGKDELPGIRDQGAVRGRPRRGIDRDVLLAQNDPGLQEYMKRLRSSRCPGCNRAQWTPRGEPMMCPVCTGRRGTVDQSSVPLEAGRRRR